MKLYKKSIMFVSAFVLSIFLVSAYGGTFQSMGKKVDDSLIVTKINLLYTKDMQLNPFKIKVSSHDGNVLLKGRVDTDNQYEKAVMLAESVHGVYNVDAKNLIVKDSKHQIADIYITAKIKGLLIKNKVLDLKHAKYWGISIETKNGVVYLSGKVDNQKQKDNIVKTAKSVSGVKSVNSAGLIVK